jgi:hypothetical protein
VNHTRHDLSKWCVALDKVAKGVVLGRDMALHIHYRATAELADILYDEHSAIKRYLDRSDARNKTGPFFLTSRLMLKCMAKAISGD